jgi:peptidoglycan-associated lipoprotein
MRVCWVVPFTILLGCAHESARSTTAQAPSGEQQASAEVPKHMEEIPASPADVKMPAQPSNTPTPLAQAPNCQQRFNVLFDFDKFNIRGDQQDQLKVAAECLKQNQNLVITLAGNADERGTQEYNQVLGANRARSVAIFLSQQGVSKDQLRTVSYGKDRPRCNERTEACWQRNRHVAFAPACKM